MVIALILHASKTFSCTLFPPSPFPHYLPVFLLLQLLFSCCCHLFHFSNERDVAGEELSQSGDIFFEAQAQKSSLFLGNKNSLLWYLTSTLTFSPAWDVLLLHCKSFGSDFLFNIVSIFTQMLTSMLNPSMFLQTLTHLLRANQTYFQSKLSPIPIWIEVFAFFQPLDWVPESWEFKTFSV